MNLIEVPKVDLFEDTERFSNSLRSNQGTMSLRFVWYSKGQTRPLAIQAVNCFVDDASVHSCPEVPAQKYPLSSWGQSNDSLESVLSQYHSFDPSATSVTKQNIIKTEQCIEKGIHDSIV